MQKKTNKDKEREKIMQQLIFDAHQIHVCRKAFLFSHAFDKSQLESISKSLESGVNDKD
jgi:hypothetical protein